jgi:hypothetical protein
MEHFRKPFVHLPIDAVDSVVFDPEGRFEAEQYDRYASFTEARDAALSSIEIMLDEADYDGDDHRRELEQMLSLLNSSASCEELTRDPEYRRIIERLDLRSGPLLPADRSRGIGLPVQRCLEMFQSLTVEPSVFATRIA